MASIQLITQAGLRIDVTIVCVFTPVAGELR